jgi:tRNA nucleotidyltransferase (CCA-adding enzyme)
MKIYLVGGAVRDRLLGLQATERDWLVTDTSPEELQQLGYRQVGKGFPVFLHPDTHEECALPRGPASAGGSGATPVEADLERRDLTINAMALGPDGELLDPCGGQRDLQNRILRHTPAFTEDPVRVLRLARFAARFHPLGFRVAPETVELVKAMVARGELDHLVPERVFAELNRVLEDDNASRFFRVLRECGALARVLPELDCLFGIPQPEVHHPEIDSGVHSLLVLEQASLLSAEAQVRFAALLHDLGKCASPEADWPRHIDHERRGVPLVESLCKRLRIPNDWRDLAVLACRHHLTCHRALELRPGTLLKLLLELDALRRPERFQRLLLACEADIRGRKGFEERPYPQGDFLRHVREAAAGIDSGALSKDLKPGEKIEERIQRARLEAISEIRKRYRRDEGLGPSP